MLLRPFSFYTPALSTLSSVFCLYSFIWSATHIRMANVEAATDAGIVGIHFKGATSLRQDLTLLGLDFSVNKDEEDPAKHKAEYFP